MEILCHEDIEKCQSIAYDPDERNDSFEGAMGLDCGFGSSKFAVVVTQFVDGVIRVVYSKEFSQPDHNEMVQLCIEQAFAFSKSHGPVCPPDCNGVRGDHPNNGKHLGQLANGGSAPTGQSSSVSAPPLE